MLLLVSTAAQSLHGGIGIGPAILARIGLINRTVPADRLDAVCEEYCQKLVGGATNALRWTKIASRKARTPLYRTLGLAGDKPIWLCD